MILMIGKLILHGNVCCKNVQFGMKRFVSCSNMCDQKKGELVIRQDVMTKFGFEGANFKTLEKLLGATKIATYVDATMLKQPKLEKLVIFQCKAQCCIIWPTFGGGHWTQTKFCWSCKVGAIRHIIEFPQTNSYCWYRHDRYYSHIQHKFGGEYNKISTWDNQKTTYWCNTNGWQNMKRGQ